ncbi:putative PurR-regulated permease PerM [Parabacteroides sp. PF5-5]|uniref:AI-2E family transporter n=1 Tax=unclassified Parabacteroides TaxID=2649774 RepID=UPI00247723D0|nr:MULTISPECIES: AI-2E family transporter [unclassified Parabacteroides]MDH6305765.1 putative PurR-regulated permease PerM [Parabacteroides sp. PH5-39]MDH6316837.1 putative PurR-regulated permease PerM [Parabacteroides sp. PF5-13]MDH6320478.1 putative PurR-regulated permease PerM [Parabacteroides sp. PH5-13]MDH6324208.1 putative PurR-regulated permease PerM [Parabacteroides sp. PH5-8]MDH6328023.1 putative PurR-regulated permease PerM [Parabacteroides sp. PH5-41]
MKEHYQKYTLIGILLLSGIILAREFTPFLGGILGAFTIYVLVRKQLFFLTEKKKWNKSLAALVLLLETILCFLIPLTLAVWLFITEIQGVNLDITSVVSQIEQLIDLIKEKTSYNILDKSNVLSVVSLLPKLGQMLMSGISGFIINIVMLLLVLYFMLVSSRSMEKYVFEILPFSDSNKGVVLREVNTLVKANALGVPLLAIIQGIIAFIGYLIFGAPSPIVFAFLTCFATIVPLLGTGLVWFPLALYLAITGDWVNALGLVAYSLIILTNIDNLVRFLLQKKLADTHPLITIFGVIIGLSLFGFMGVIFGPILLASFILCFNIFKTEYMEGKN